MCLQATASYRDDMENTATEDIDTTFIDETLDRAHNSADDNDPVEPKTTANKAPSFTAEDLDEDGTDETGMADAPFMREVDENEDADTNVGNPLGVDDDDTALIYTLGGADAAAFEIGSSTGQITTAEKLDYEMKPSYMVAVTATDPSQASGTAMVMITVNDKNDGADIRLNTAPEFDAETAERSVAENSAAGTAVGDPVVATDGDTGDSLTYSLDAMGDMHFDIDDMGQITVGEGTMLDFESGMTSHTVTVTATDTARLYAMITVTIMVTDVNEAPVFASDTAMISVPENTPTGTEIGDPFAATDVDAGATLEYSLGGDDEASFAIDAASGQLMTVDELDYETKSSYTVTVMASDGELYAEITVTVAVSVDNVNEAPVFDEGDLADRDVDENTEAGMAFGDPITATDVDAGDMLTYTLDAAGDMNFDIDPATGQLMTEAALDHETMASHTVTVTATDSAGLYAMIAVTIAVNDVPEMSMFDAETATFMVYENMDVGSAVGTVTAEHAESYLDDSDYFDVDDMGNITTAMVLDYESMTSHSVTVTATAADASTDSIAVTVNVGNVEECEDAGATAVADTANAGAMADCEALLASRDALMGEDATRMLNWSADTPIAEWYGVRKLSESGRVEWLYLHGVRSEDATDDAPAMAEVKLNGTIPAELGGLTEMTRLYLHRNNLSGAIPSELNGLTKLVWLHLYDNMLSGEIPDLSGMTSLERLYLHSNNLTGGIPAELNGLTNLVWLRLYDNMLSGEIPDLSDMASLERFYVHQNDLTGGVPTALSNSVTHILVHRNMLTGDIPDLSGMTNLVWLGLYDNMLSGEIPASVGGIAKLKRLYLHGNALTGAVPMEIGNIASLTNLWLENNMLSGELPSSLNELTNLERVQIIGGDNAFTGCIPAALANADITDTADTDLLTCVDDGS